MTFVPSNQETYSLIPRPTVEDAFGVSTPFRGFLDALYDQISHKEMRTNRGAVMWQGYPIGLLIGFGLMPVLQRLAQKHEQPFVTLADQSRTMAVADPLIQAGLVLRYVSMQEAAEDFVRRVIDSTDYFLSLGWRPGMTLSAAALEEWEKTGVDSLVRREIARQQGHLVLGETSVAGVVWQRPVARFFRDLIVDSQEKAKEWFLRIRELQTRATPVRCGKTFLPLTAQSAQYLALSARRLEPDFSKLQVPVELHSEIWWREFFSGTERTLHTHGLWLTVLDELPLRSCRIARSAVEEGEMGDSARGPSTFAEAWFTTQALLALLHRPLSAMVSVRVYEYVQGLQALSRLGKKALSCVMDRLEHLAPEISDTSRQIIRNHVSNLLQEMLAWDKRPTVDMQAHVFLDARYGEIVISPRDALDYATGDDVVLSMQIPRGAKDRAEIYKNIAEALPWEEVNAVTMHAMIKEGAIPLVMIARGLARIPLERREPCLDIFLNAAVVDKDILRVLIDERVLTLSGYLVGRFFDLLSANDLKNWMLRLIPGNATSLEDVRGQVRLVLKALMRLPAQDVHELLDHPSNRRWWAQEVFGELYDKQGFDGLDIPLPAWRIFVSEMMGEDRWIRFMLTGSVLEREILYTSLTLKFADNYRAPWDRLHILSMSELDWSFIFAKEGDALAEIFRQYAEEDILAWAHADESLEVFADRLRAFLDNRAAFYARFGTTPPTPSNEE